MISSSRSACLAVKGPIMNLLVNMQNNRDSCAQLALVTVNSSGIGRAFGLRLGADGQPRRRRPSRDRLEELAAALPNVKVRPLVVDLGTDAGVAAVDNVGASEELTFVGAPFNLTENRVFRRFSGAEKRHCLDLLTDSWEGTEA